MSLQTNDAQRYTKEVYTVQIGIQVSAIQKYQKVPGTIRLKTTKKVQPVLERIR